LSLPVAVAGLHLVVTGKGLVVRVDLGLLLA
jgi:hypothetical protein